LVDSNDFQQAASSHASAASGATAEATATAGNAGGAIASSGAEYRSTNLTLCYWSSLLAAVSNRQVGSSTGVVVVIAWLIQGFG